MSRKTRKGKIIAPVYQDGSRRKEIILSLAWREVIE
jgi:hypothetical protein